MTDFYHSNALIYLFSGAKRTIGLSPQHKTPFIYVLTKQAA